MLKNDGTLTNRMSASFKSASSCSARWVRICWSLLLASKASCTNSLEDFFLFDKDDDGSATEVIYDGCQKKFKHVTGARNQFLGTDSRTYSCFAMANASAKRIGEPDLYIFNSYLIKHQQIKTKARLRFWSLVWSCQRSSLCFFVSCLEEILCLHLLALWLFT